jgi:nucleotide-binding universal stress UspA family protein
MIVAGAFGHNRLREMLLGSATRELLEKSARPLLLSH